MVGSTKQKIMGQALAVLLGNYPGANAASATLLAYSSSLKMFLKNLKGTTRRYISGAIILCTYRRENPSSKKKKYFECVLDIFHRLQEGRY
jgi:hypothetical protein